MINQQISFQKLTEAVKSVLKEEADITKLKDSLQTIIDTLISDVYKHMRPTRGTEISGVDIIRLIKNRQPEYSQDNETMLVVYNKLLDNAKETFLTDTGKYSLYLKEELLAWLDSRTTHLFV